MKFRVGGILSITMTIFSAGTAQAAGGEGIKFLGGDFSYNGMIRLETAFSTSSETAPANQYGDPANGVTIRRDAGNPLDGWRTKLNVGGLLGNGNPLTTVVIGLITPGETPLGVIETVGVSDTFARYVPPRDQDLNYHILRFEATPSITWGDWSFVSRIRAVYDPGDMGYQDFDYNDYDDINGGITGGTSRQFHGEPDFFGYAVEGEKNPILFERSGRNYMVDLPAFFGQWTNGETTVRIGNQSVAWGQLLFFRVMDVANGLDLRRHLFIDRAIEEYADERMSAPGIRVTVQATDDVVVDAFAQQFIPTVLNNVNTPYNVVPSQFTLRDRYVEHGYDNDINYGFRVKGEFGNFNLQAMATSRLNPLGSIRWSKSGVNKALPNSNLLGLAFNQYCAVILLAAGRQADNGCGPILAETAFEVAPAGVFSAEEWFNYAGYIRLDALDGLNRAIDEFPDAQLLLAQPVGQDPIAANNELDAFFMAGEGLRGHIERDYYREEIYGLGGGYVIEAEPGSILDQLIINVEATYAKDRTFTAVDLRHDYDVRDEVQIGLVLEKYQRFSSSFPATYMVFQYLWQKESDLVGLLLDGYGSENFSDQGVVLNPDIPTSANPRINPGVAHANYLVFAFLQPTDAYVYEFSAAALIDVQGGVLIQPAIQWKPRGNMTVNLFYNYVDGDAWGGNPNKNTIGLIDFADEVGVRLGYQF